MTLNLRRSVVQFYSAPLVHFHSALDIEAIYRRPRTSRPDSRHKVYPYVLKGLQIDKVNQVWGTDI